MTHGVKGEKVDPKLHLFTRSPFLEMGSFGSHGSPPDLQDCAPETLQVFGDTINYIRNMKSPRVIKTHFPFEYLPPNLLKTCKGNYVH